MKCLLYKLKLWFSAKLNQPHTVAKIYDDESCIMLRSDGWVIITDGYSSDAIPIFMCSPQLQSLFEEKMKRNRCLKREDI